VAICSIELFPLLHIAHLFHSYCLSVAYPLLYFFALTVPDEEHRVRRFSSCSLHDPPVTSSYVRLQQGKATRYPDCNVEGCSNVLVADGLIDQDESQFVLYHLLI